MQLKLFTIDDICAFVDGLSQARRKTLSLLLGALSALSFAPLYIFPFYMVALPLLLIMAIRASDHRAAFSYGYIFGFGHFVLFGQIDP